MTPGRALLALALLAACRSVVPPSPELLQQLERAPKPPAPCLRQDCTVDVSSAELSGRFTARVAACLAWPRARMQWFPDLGAKVLDLLVAPDQVHATIPPAGIVFAHDGRDTAPRHLLYWMAVSLLEQLVPLTAERVVGTVVEDGRQWLVLRPLCAGTEVEALIDKDGRVCERRFLHRHVPWSVTSSGTAPEVITVTGAGFQLRVLVHGTEFAASLPEAVFALPRGQP